MNSSRNPEALGVSEARGARGLARYLQDQDIRVYQTDSFEGDTTQGKEKKKSFWSKKKYWILAISVISIMFFALTLGLSLYFGLYYEEHETEGNSYIRKILKFLRMRFSGCASEQLYFLNTW